MADAAIPDARARLASIDIVRGIVLMLMALDHVRYFLTDRSYPPEDLLQTDLPLFLVRWVTHFCAPGFFLTAGLAVYLAGQRRGTAGQAWFLVTRGLWMIALELTVIGFAWSFVPGSSFGGVIWSFGVAFLVLAALRQLKPSAVAAIGVVYLLLHDALDRDGLLGDDGFLWRLLEWPGPVMLPGGVDWFVLFPVLPWAAMLCIGYGLGPLYTLPFAQCRRWLLLLGAACSIAFVLLRVTNAYGNPDTLWITGAPAEFGLQPSAAETLMALLNTEKYPPSLQFSLMTLGPLLLLLGGLARFDRQAIPLRLWSVVETVGRVPMFFYLLHLYLIHLLALALWSASGQPSCWLGWMGGGTHPQDGSGFGLGTVMIVWLGVCAVLYLACRRYARLRRERSWWWLRYL